MSATSVLKLVVDDKEYGPALKNAKQGMQALQESLQAAGKSFLDVDKSVVEYAKALGNMATASKTAKGKIGEMSSAFVELSVQYKHLTDQEKQSPVGKAMAESLETLKTRVIDAKNEIKEFEGQLQPVNSTANDTGGILGQLKDKFTINIDALKLFNAGLTAAKAALDVAKDAFFASEANVDEWGRTMEAGKSLYEGFLTALNTGDISGYLGRIDSIVQAAREAYNELDRLGTMKTIQAPKMSAQQTENERMRMMIQTGRYIAPLDGRGNAVWNGKQMQNGQLLAPEQIRILERQLQGGMQKVVTLVGNEVKQTGKAIDAVYNRQAQELGLSLKDFRKGTSSMAEFDKRMEGYNQYQKWRAEHTTIDLQSGRETVARGNPFEQFAKWGAFRVDGGRYNDLVRLIQQRDQQAGQAYSMQSQAYRTMNRAEGMTVRSIMGGGSSGSGGSVKNTIKEDKDDFEEIIGLIPNAEERVKSLKEQIRTSWDEGEISSLTEDLKAAEAELQRLQNIGKKTKISFTQGLSGFNAQTMGAWMQGRQGDLSKAEYGSADYSSIMGNIADMNTIKTIFEQSMKAGVDAAQIDLEPLWEKVFDGQNIPDSTWQSLVDIINEKLKEMEIDPIKVNFETGSLEQANKGAKESQKEFRAAASAISQAGAAMQSIEDPGVKIMGMIGQAIASIALGFATASAQEGKGGVWYWIAATAAGLATMVATISSIHNATGYANGGMIEGNSYSGDNLMAQGPDGGLIGLNAGEVILSKSMQNNLVNSLNGNGLNNINVAGRIRGTDIILSVDRSLQLQGKQLLTWGR